MPFDRFVATLAMTGSWRDIFGGRINPDGPLGRRISARFDACWLAWLALATEYVAELNRADAA